jgi:DNA-binding transcriptional MerR regulator/effector-binding domain-containing protein
MATLLTIGDFSRMTHLSVKALRHYHDVGVLAPAVIDPFTGYRSYEASQVPAAQVIRRLRDLGMPLDGIRAVLTAPDVKTRNAEIAAHLAHMERQLAQVQSSVSGLRALLTGPATRLAVEVRAIPAVTALAIVEVVTVPGFEEWLTGVLGDLSGALAGPGLAQAGCFAALYPGDFFELERAEVTVFLPVEVTDGAGSWDHPGPGGRLGPGRVRLTEIPAVDAAVAVHEGSVADIDRTYAALGTEVAERVIGVDGPIREYYLTGFSDPDESTHRVEVCWPVFRTVG